MSAAVTRTIAWYELLSNTASGNPRYRIHFEGEPSAITSSDAAFCYAIGNPGMRSGDTVSVTYTRSGRIARMEGTV